MITKEQIEQLMNKLQVEEEDFNKIVESDNAVNLDLCKDQCKESWQQIFEDEPMFLAFLCRCAGSYVLGKSVKESELETEEQQEQALKTYEAIYKYLEYVNIDKEWYKING